MKKVLQASPFLLSSFQRKQAPYRHETSRTPRPIRFSYFLPAAQFKSRLLWNDQRRPLAVACEERLPTQIETDSGSSAPDPLFILHLPDGGACQKSRLIQNKKQRK